MASSPSLHQMPGRYPGDASNKTDLIKLAKRYFILDDGYSEIDLICRIQFEADQLGCFATVPIWTCGQFECR